MKQSNIAVIIPARMDASRLPAKPLAIIGGEPMIVHVMRRAIEAGFETPIIACDHEDIFNAVEKAGGKAVMTSDKHPSGSDRVQEAANIIDPDRKINTIINLQGDLPFIDGRILMPLAESLEGGKADIATPFAQATKAEAELPQVVKAAIAFPEGQCEIGDSGRVLYFSRQKIPANAGVALPIWHHIGIYAWRRDALERFVTLKPSPLEKAEKLEQLRALENGMTINGLVVSHAPKGVDTPQDLDDARKQYLGNSI